MAAILIFPAAAARGGEPSRAKIEALLADMALRGQEFPPEKLLALGPEGLSAVLDWLLPETADTKPVAPPDAVLKEVIGQLSDESCQVREAATQRLYELGPGAQAAAAEAARSPDAEVSWRAVRVMRAWDEARNLDNSRYVPALAQCLEQVRDRPSLERLDERMLRLLTPGMPSSGSKQRIVIACIAALAATEDDRYLDPLRPLLDHQNARVTRMVLQSVATGLRRKESTSYCPQLLLDALASTRAEVLTAALENLPACPDSPHAPQLRQRLQSLFTGENETLKFRACRPLMLMFDDGAALDFVLAQAKQTQDRQRQWEAIALLGAPHKRREPIPPKVLATVREMLDRNDMAHLRTSLANALGNYTGEDVIRALVPLLADNFQPVQQVARQRLLDQPDRPLVRRLLTEASKDASKPQLQRQAEQLLAEAKEQP